MAATERILISTPPLLDSKEGATPLAPGPGLRISVRTTTASFTDYPDWNLEELSLAIRGSVVVTDGDCS
jgi:hypothetical protein